MINVAPMTKVTARSTVRKAVKALIEMMLLMTKDVRRDDDSLDQRDKALERRAVDEDRRAEGDEERTRR